MPQGAPARPREVTEVCGGEVLDIGGGAHVVHVPGHTNGSVALRLPRHGAPRPFTWTETADEILNLLADYLAKVGTTGQKTEQDQPSGFPAQHTSREPGPGRCPPRAP